MYSMLQKIDEYIKENGIPFKEITFSYTYLDPYLDQVITSRIRKITGNDFNMGCLSYTLKYDNSGNLCLIANSNDDKSTFIIFDKSKTNKVDLPGSFNACGEKTIIEEAAMLKYLYDDRLLIRNRLYEMYPDISISDRVIAENRILEDLMKVVFRELKENDERILKKVHYKDLYVENTNRIIDYIEYLNDAYQNDLKFAKLKEEEHKVMYGICYSEPESDTVTRKNFDNNGYNYGHKEKKYPVISFDDRYQILESYPYLYREYAYTTDRKEITFMNYLYNIGNNKYLLVMEPYNGVRATKIAIFESNETITREKFNELIRFYLQLSYIEALEEKSLIRSNHTSLETYKKNIDYAIVGVNNGLTNVCFMGKVNRLKK